MKTKHLPDPFLMTTHLNICDLVLRHDDEMVYMTGVYGDLLDGDYKPLTLWCNFQQFNDLLPTEDEALCNELTDQLSTYFSSSNKERLHIELGEKGGLVFTNKIFTFQCVPEENDDNGSSDPYTTFSYALILTLNRGILLPDFFEELPQEPKEKIHYYHRQLAVYYEIYKTVIKNLPDDIARNISNLNDPLKFELAKAYYEGQ